MALTDTARLATVLTLKDGLSPGLKKASGNVGKFDKGMGRASGSAGKMAGGFAKAGAVIAGATVVGLGFAAKAAIEWEDAFQGVVKTVDASDEEFAALSDSIRKMSTEMPIAATELAAIAEAGGAMGIKAKDIEAFTKQVAILASTTNVSAEDAASALGQLQNVIGLTGDEFDNFAAALVDLGNKGASTEADILEIARRAGGAAKLFGIGKDAILGWSSAVANLGVQSELGGTALQNVFLKLMPKVSNESKTLQKIFGKTGKEIKRLFAKDAGKGLETFIQKLAKLPKAARLDAIQSVFGKGSGITRVLLGLTNNVDGLHKSLEDGEKAWKEEKAAAEEFAKRNATVKSAILRLKNGITDAAVSIGEGFAPALGRAADKLSEFLKQDKNRKKLEDFGKKIGDFIDKVDFDKATKGAEGFINALKPAIDVIAQIASAIAKLPPEVIGVGGATILADRLSGGVISSAGGSAIGGLAESLAKSMAAHIPVFGKAFVQPVFVTNAGFGLPGGPGGKIPPLPVGPGIIKPAIGAGVAFDLQAFHRDFAKPAIARLGAVEDAIKDLPGQITTPPGGGRGVPNRPGGPGGGARSAAQLRASVEGTRKATQEVESAVNTKMGKVDQSVIRNRDAVHSAARQQVAKQQAAIQAFRAGERQVSSSVNSSKNAITGRLSSANAKLDAIRHKRTTFTANFRIPVSVSVRSVQGANNKASAYAGKSLTKMFE